MKHTFLAAIALLIAAPLIAGDGAVPIWEPTTITEPGKYVLTRNIASSTGPVLLIDSVSDVHLDLGGFTVLYTGSDSSAIEVRDTGSLTIRNGTIRVNGTGQVYGVWLSDCTGYDLSHLNFVVAGTAYVAGIRSRDSQGMIRHNVISGGGIDVSDGAARISGNSVTDASFAIILSANSTVTAVVEDNLVVDCGKGIVTSIAQGSTIARNTVRGCSDEGILMTGPGIVHGTHNLVEENLMTGNGVGLKFEHSDHNVYRGNTARGNTVDFVDGGTGNTSHGDNYMPNLM